MKLSAGITDINPAWHTLLTQIGLPYHILKPGEKFSSADYPVIILTGKPEIDKKELLEYISEGGSVITEADTAKKFLKIKLKRKYIKYLVSEKKDVFNAEGICDIRKRCSIASGANQIINQNGEDTVLSTQINKGNLIVFPSGFVNLLFDDRIMRKNFPSSYGKKETNERVAAVSKGMIYHFISNALEYLYHVRGLPFVTLWQYPYGAESVFLFRIDTDFGSRAQINQLYALLNKYNVKGTWFVETSSSNNFLNDFNTFVNQEIALHCYRHRVFSSYNKNRANIEEGLNKLKHNHILASGFAAPYGQWNPSLGKAINDLKFSYSSEFGYAYDSYPFYPVEKGDVSSSLQIPVHPVSLGRLHWGGHKPEDMVLYFRNLFRNNLSSYFPVAMYVHPSELKFNVLNDILDSAVSLNIPSYTFREFSLWWKGRMSLQWEAEVTGSIRINTYNKSEEYWVRVSTRSGTVYISPLTDQFNKTVKEINLPVWKPDNRSSAEDLRRKTLRMYYHDFLSTYRKLKQ